MENATRALIIVAGVFLAGMILGLGIYLYTSLGTYVSETSATMEKNALNAFNTQFFDYINEDTDGDGDVEFDLRIQDIVTVANIAYENNKNYDLDSGASDGSTFYVQVHVKTSVGGIIKTLKNLEKDISTDSASLLQEHIGKKYECKSDWVKVSQITGRVYEVYFEEI